MISNGIQRNQQEAIFQTWTNIFTVTKNLLVKQKAQLLHMVRMTSVHQSLFTKYHRTLYADTDLLLDHLVGGHSKTTIHNDIQ